MRVVVGIVGEGGQEGNLIKGAENLIFLFHSIFCMVFCLPAETIMI